MEEESEIVRSPIQAELDLYYFDPKEFWGLLQSFGNRGFCHIDKPSGVLVHPKDVKYSILHVR